MGFRETLEQLLATGDGAAAESPDEESDRTVIHECRNCGTAVTSNVTTCPTCGAEEIATYAIE